MTSLLERLREALTPDYEVERELGRGGMGVVFLGRDVRLNMRVAIKVLLPDRATGANVERFLREARILASFNHPHIVPVHKVSPDTGDEGLFYYIMAHMEGPTLRQLLMRGPLSRDRVRKLGRDVLDALQAVHERDHVHRDIKPENLFLVGNRTLVGDFGIAKASPNLGQSLTEEGSLLGTPTYMAPEQLAAGQVTGPTDLYVLAMVLFEALTGRKWQPGKDPAKAGWSGVPRGLFGRGIRRVLRRALAVAPEDRWQDALTFRRKLWETRIHEYWLRAAGLTAGGMIIGALVVWPLSDWRAEGGPPAGGLAVRVASFEQLGGTATLPWLADSVTARVRRDLSGSPDFRVLGPDDSPTRGLTVVLHGSVAVTGERLTLEVTSEGWLGVRRPVHARVEGEAANWQALADAITYETLSDLWGESSPLRRWLPRDALPETVRGFNAWLAAEQMFNGARWEEADDAFRAAVEIDSTCWLCYWRITEVGRQLAERIPDPVHMQKALEQIDRFPVHYRPLILVPTLSLPARLDTLSSAAENWSDFYYPWFLLGEEQFHRGPLLGHLRSRSLDAFRRAAQLRPEFGSTWEHLAWILIAEGDADGAERALDSLLSRPHPPDYTPLLQLAFQYRFKPPEVAGAVARAVLQDSSVLARTDLATGARWLPSFEAFNGAVDLGRLYTEIPDRPLVALSGHLAQVFGHFTMGEVEAARDRARAIGRAFPEAEWLPLFMAQLDAALYMFDSAGAAPDPHNALVTLRRYAAPGTGPATDQRRAAWTAAMLAARLGDEPQAEAFREQVAAGSAAHPLTLLLRADSLARAGEFGRALVLGDSLRPWEHASRVPGPFFRTLAHLLRAQWYEEVDNLEAARRELRWHESFDFAGLATGAPTVEEVDWAFGTVARWHRARLLDRMGETSWEVCATNAAVARIWQRGDGVYRVRADSARRRLEELACEVGATDLP